MFLINDESNFVFNEVIKFVAPLITLVIGFYFGNSLNLIIKKNVVKGEKMINKKKLLTISYSRLQKEQQLILSLAVFKIGEGGEGVKSAYGLTGTV